MKQHFCPAEQLTIAFEKECNWCGEQEGSMTQDEIIEMATQVSERNYGRIIFFEFEVEELEAFAKLVAAKALSEQERNFCSRCGKRTADLTTIHTCTPPQD
jgi:hypothetical protein